MKSNKILKILGVGVTIAMVFSLGIALMATPVSADPDEWSTYDLPDQGEDGNYFWDNTIDAGPGPIDMDIDGNLWAYVSIGADEDLVMSSDGGRSWDVTDYNDDTDAAAITAIVCSPIDADIVYVAAATKVWKTDDAGDNWDDLGAPDANNISAMTVGEGGDTHYIYVATDSAAATPDLVYYYEDAFGGAWTDLDLEDQDADLEDVLALQASPDFDNDGLVFAVFTTDAGDETYVAYNDSASVGAAGWESWEIQSDGDAKFLATAAAIAIPDDFDQDDAFEFFVGVSGPAHVGSLGGVYRIYGDTTALTDLLDDVEDEVMSLDVVGDIGNTYLMAGIDGAIGDAGVADVWYSDDDGDNWLQASAEGISPAGDADTYVICGDDIADDGMGWAATDGTGAGVQLTMSGGESWVGISLMDTDADALHDIGPSPEWASDGTMFVAYENAAGDDEVLRYDGDNWDRVWEDTQYATVLGVTGDIDMIDCSPEFGSDDTVFAGLSDAGGGPEVFVSDDGGTVWADTRNVPDTLASWAIVDADTIIAGGAGDSTVYITDRQGRRAWDDYEVEAGGANDITSLAVWGDTVICGDDSNAVFISEDFGEDWDVVGADLDSTAAAATYVGFDTDFDTTNTIYAASDDVIARFLDVSDLDADWEDFTPESAPTAISGLAVADGVVYVSDAASADAGVEGAVERTPNPLEDLDDVDESDFDQMIEGLDADAGGLEIFDSLYAVEGSTTLFAVDTANATIWTIEDLLAVAATGGAANADVDSALMTWNGFDNATDYEVRVYSDADMGMAYEWFDDLTGDDDGVLNLTENTTTGAHAGDALDSGTKYWWQVRAAEPVHSKWSDIWTFTTEPETMTIDADTFAPALGATDVPILASFGWEDIEEADSYTLEVADNPNFTTPIVSVTVTTSVYELDSPLNYATNYFWRVKAVSGTSESRWATGNFTTVSAPVEAVAPAPPAQTPTVTIPPAQQVAPKWIYAVIGVGATLAVVVIVLIVRTRKP